MSIGVKITPSICRFSPANSALTCIPLNDVGPPLAPVIVAVMRPVESVKVWTLLPVGFADPPAEFEIELMVIVVPSIVLTPFSAGVENVPLPPFMIKVAT